MKVVKMMKLHRGWTKAWSETSLPHPAQRLEFQWHLRCLKTQAHQLRPLHHQCQKSEVHQLKNPHHLSRLRAHLSNPRTRSSGACHRHNNQGPSHLPAARQLSPVPNQKRKTLIPSIASQIKISRNSSKPYRTQHQHLADRDESSQRTMTGQLWKALAMRMRMSQISHKVAVRSNWPPFFSGPWRLLNHCPGLIVQRLLELVRLRPHLVRLALQAQLFLRHSLHLLLVRLLHHLLLRLCQVAARLLHHLLRRCKIAVRLLPLHLRLHQAPLQHVRKLRCRARLLVYPIAVPYLTRYSWAKA